MHQDTRRKARKPMAHQQTAQGSRRLAVVVLMTVAFSIFTAPSSGAYSVQGVKWNSGKSDYYYCRAATVATNHPSWVPLISSAVGRYNSLPYPNPFFTRIATNCGSRKIVFSQDSSVGGCGVTYLSSSDGELFKPPSIILSSRHFGRAQTPAAAILLGRHCMSTGMPKAYNILATTRSRTTLQSCGPRIPRAKS